MLFQNTTELLAKMKNLYQQLWEDFTTVFERPVLQ
jgi:hypothetical protein